MRNFIIIIAITAFSLFSANTLQAKSPIQFGVRGGLQTQSLGTFKDIVSTDMTQLSSDNRVGYQLGIMSRISLLGLYIQPELVYSSNSFNLIANGNTKSRFNVQDFDVPILVGVKVLFLRFFAGPVFNIMSETSNKSDVDLTTRLTKAATAYQLGAGVELGNFNVDLRYGGQFKKTTQMITFDGKNSTVKSSLNAWQINVGYFF